MAKKEKTNLYLLAIVAIVAVVGIVVLVLNSGTFFWSSVSKGKSTNLAGQAVAVGVYTCTDSDGGYVPGTKGTATVTLIADGSVVTSKTDKCLTARILSEVACNAANQANYTNTSCKPGAVCYHSACGTDSDRDGVTDSYDTCVGSDDTVDADSDGTPDGCDVCSGYDDTVDTDSDGTPDGCDDDDDGDGYTDAEETAAGTDTLDAADYPLPDLVFDEAETTVFFEGSVWITNLSTTPEALNNSVNASVIMGIKNQGFALATGTSYYSGNLYDYGGGTVASPSFDSLTLYIMSGDTYGVVGVDRAPISGLLFLSEIYNKGTADVILHYKLDYATTKYIIESDETNNVGEYTMTIDECKQIATGATTYVTETENCYDLDFKCVDSTIVSTGSTTFTTIYTDIACP